MNLKQVVGVVLFVVGFVALVWAIHAMHNIEQAQGVTQDVENFFTHNPKWWNSIIKFFGGKPQTEVSKHHFPQMVLFFSGIVLIIAGAVAVVRYRRR